MPIGGTENYNAELQVVFHAPSSHSVVFTKWNIELEAKSEPGRFNSRKGCACARAHLLSNWRTENGRPLEDFCGSGRGGGGGAGRRGGGVACSCASAHERFVLWNTRLPSLFAGSMAVHVEIVKESTRWNYITHSVGWLTQGSRISGLPRFPVVVPRPAPLSS